MEVFAIESAAAGAHRSGNSMAWLTSLPAAAALHADQLLQLLTVASQNFEVHSGWPVLQQLVVLLAWQQLNPGQFVEVLEVCLKQHLNATTCSNALCTQLCAVLAGAPSDLQLTPADVYKLFAGVMPFLGSLQVAALLLEQPAGQRISTDEVGDLLQCCIRHSHKVGQAAQVAGL